jgi:uncharacterized membrane protein YfcA
MNEPLTYLVLCVTSFFAGAINAVAGGGTLLTFPALMSVMSPRAANVTSTVALVPGSFAGAWGYRKELAGSRRWLLLLAGPSFIGGLVGSLLLILMDPDYFKAIVPWLLLTASLLFMAQPIVNRYLKTSTTEQATTEEALPSTGRCVIVGAFQFLVGIYGGYFGAGIGILTLSALGLMGLHDIHRMNAVKTALATCINAVSVVVFAFSGEVHWYFGIAMALASIAGGYTGARVSRRLPKALVRWIVIVIGLGLSVYYFTRSD